MLATTAGGAKGKLPDEDTNCDVAMMLAWLQRQAAGLHQEAVRLQAGIKRSHACLSQPAEPPEEMLARAPHVWTLLHVQPGSLRQPCPV